MRKQVKEIMEIGASSACFYPLETERAFLHIAELGFRNSEIFFNSASELRPDFIRELKTVKEAYGMEVVSLHPYRSFAEGHDFFSSYKRRYHDAVEGYKRYFEAAATLGAKYIVMHGARNRMDITREQYAERFGKLNEAARSFGCTVAHENVVYFISEAPDFALFMKGYLGDSFKMVLDVKQARRAGVNAQNFIDVMGNNIVHVHLSDFDEAHDCIPPSEKGLFDFENLFRELHKAGYNGKYMIELYSNGYEKQKEIIDSARYLDPILKRVRQGE